MNNKIKIENMKRSVALTLIVVILLVTITPGCTYRQLGDTDITGTTLHNGMAEKVQVTVETKDSREGSGYTCYQLSAGETKEDASVSNDLYSPVKVTVRWYRMNAPRDSEGELNPAHAGGSNTANVEKGEHHLRITINSDGTISIST